MRTKTDSLIYLLLLMGVLLIFAGSCKKDDETNAAIPVLTTTAITDITQNTAKSGGNITSDGGATITARGVCWSTKETPTILDNKTTDGAGTGSFVSSISGLTINTPYYIRAYATNRNGTGYGMTMSFTAESKTFTDMRDGNVYHTVTIGTQTWMVENLCYLPSVVEPATGSDTTPCYYVYGYNGTIVNNAKATANYTTYGVLYNWAAAMTACPTGWHLPSDAEWTQLTEYLGGENFGYKLKEAGTTHWLSNNYGATNETGFTALPGGCRFVDGTFISIGSDGLWWSATEKDSQFAWRWALFYYQKSIDRNYAYKLMGFSVRCVRD